MQHKDGYCNPCDNLVPKKLKAELCIGVSGRVCGREIELVNQYRKCYYDPEEKTMREKRRQQCQNAESMGAEEMS